MKTKKQFAKKFLSILICATFVISYMHFLSITANAASLSILGFDKYGITVTSSYAKCTERNVYHTMFSGGHLNTTDNVTFKIEIIDDKPINGFVTAQFVAQYDCAYQNKTIYRNGTFELDCSCDKSYEYGSSPKVYFDDGSTISIHMERSAKAHKMDWKSNGNNTHTSTCSACDETVTEACGGATDVTCTKYGTCTACGASYNAPNVHEWKYSVRENIITKSCDCNKVDNATATLSADKNSYAYTGSEITPLYVKYSFNWTDEKPTIMYFNNTELGYASGSITINGCTATKTFKIEEANISDATITLNPKNGTYNGSAYAPDVTVTFNGATLVKDTDYVLSWEPSELTNAGSYTATITGKGNFKGTKNAVFSINPAEIKGAVVTLNQNTFVYDGLPHKPTAIVTFNGDTLTEGVDYEVYYLSSDQIMKWNNGEPEKFFGTGKESCDSINAGQYYAVVFGKGNFADNGRFAYAAYTIKKATVTEPTIASKPYTGSAQTADITDTELYTVVKNDGGTGVKLNGYYDVVLKLKDSANYKWSTTDNAQVTLQFAITRAENEWAVNPSISEWIYGETANEPVGEAKFGEVSVGYSGTTNGGAAYNGVAAPTEAGSYTATFIVQETEDYKGLETSVDFTIAKADQAAPTGLTKTDTTYFGKADGKISGLTSAMEFRKEGASAYTAGFNGTLEYLAAGTYYVRYQGDANHNPSPDAVVTVNAGRKLQIVVPQNQVGYTVTVNKTEMEYEGSYTLKVEIHEGYTATEDFKIIISNWECGQQAGVEKTYMNAIADQIIEVRGVADITSPAAEIKVKENKWTSFWNNLTFGLFFKETQDVRITANDKGVGMDAIYYYLADSELELDEVKAIADWQEYNGAFQINPNNRYVIYAKAVDKNGNTTYINSAKGIVLDSIAPVLYGIENGGVYHGDKIFKAVDDNFLKIEVDGVDVTDTTEGDDEYKIVADNAEHTVTITDKAGNVTEIKITVYKRYMVTYTDGEGSSYEKEFNYGEVITIPTNEIFNDTFRRGGYTLTGWQGYTEGMTMPLSPVTLTALYKPKQYTVSFNANGGETIEPITVTFDEKYGNLPSSAIAGLSGGNKNWYLIDAYGNVTETNIKNLTLVTTARDHTLFIKRNVLAPNISITLAVPGGISDGYQYYIPGASQRVLTATVGNMNTDILDYAYKWYKDGALIEGATSNVLTLDGNVADSGTYKAEVTATLKDGTNIVVNSDTATASKEQKVKILHATNMLSYDANGGEEGPQSSYTGGATLNVSKDVPTRTYYDFIGWNTKPDGSGDSYKADELYTFAEDNGNGGCVVTLYAQWKLVEHTVTYTADGQIIATEKVEHGKDATLPDVPAKDGYVGKWDADGKNVVEDTTINVIYTAISVVKPDDVKPGDKTNLEDTKTKLEEMLDDDYSDDDKKNIQEAIDSIDNALEVIGNVEAVEELIDKLPENITKNDEATVKAADDAYNALTDYEKSLVDKDAKKALDDAKAVLAELNKPTVPTSPQTGDNSNLWLWFALMFVSGSGIFGIALYERKRKVNNQR